MSLCLLWVVTSLFDRSDWPKLLGLLGAMLALYILARKLSGRDDAMPPPSEVPEPVETEAPAMEAPDGQYPEVEHLAKVDYEPEIKAKLESRQPRNIRIVNWNFEQFDLPAGPPDPENFADYLWTELYDASTGHAWKETRFVATPAGLAKMLRQKKWSSMEIPQTLVMSRYDPKELRAAVLDQLGAIETLRGDVSPEDGDAAAAKA